MVVNTLNINNRGTQYYHKRNTLEAPTSPRIDVFRPDGDYYNFDFSVLVRPFQYWDFVTQKKHFFDTMEP